MWLNYNLVHVWKDQINIALNKCKLREESRRGYFLLPTLVTRSLLNNDVYFQKRGVYTAAAELLYFYVFYA